MKKVLLVIVTIFWALCTVGIIARLFWELPKPAYVLMAIGYISMTAAILYRYYKVHKGHEAQRPTSPPGTLGSGS